MQYFIFPFTRKYYFSMSTIFSGIICIVVTISSNFVSSFLIFIPVHTTCTEAFFLWHIVIITFNLVDYVNSCRKFLYNFISVFVSNVIYFNETCIKNKGDIPCTFKFIYSAVQDTCLLTEFPRRKRVNLSSYLWCDVIEEFHSREITYYYYITSTHLSFFRSPLTK